MATPSTSSMTDSPYPTSNQEVPSNSGNGSGSSPSAMQRAVQGAHAAVDNVARRIETAVDRVKSGAQTTAQTVQEGAGEIAEMEREMLESVRSTVRAHPLLTIGLAVAAGMLLSRLIASSSR